MSHLFDCYNVSAFVKKKERSKMRHLKNRETNGGQIKEQDVPLTQDNSFMTVCDCHCLDGSLISYVWLPNSWQQQEKALEAAHSLKTYLRIILEVFSFSPQFHSLLVNQNPGNNKSTSVLVKILYWILIWIILLQMLHWFMYFYDFTIHKTNFEITSRNFRN